MDEPLENHIDQLLRSLSNKLDWTEEFTQKLIDGLFHQDISVFSRQDNFAREVMQCSAPQTCLVINGRVIDLNDPNLKLPGRLQNNVELEANDFDILTTAELNQV